MTVPRADGSSRLMRFSTVLIQLAGREAGVTVLLAPEGAEALLGVEALEALGLSVDPTSHRLEPTACSQGASNRTADGPLAARGLG